MPRKKRQPLSHIEVLRRLARSGLSGSPPINRPTGSTEQMDSLQKRVDFLLGIVNRPQIPATHMLCFIMYDIESNKVRTEIAKYLIDKGCFRIQKSIFLAELDRAVVDEIKNDLAEVQALYENHDSIIVCPVATDEIRAMKVIGQQINLDVITRATNTLFF